VPPRRLPTRHNVPSFDDRFDSRPIGKDRKAFSATPRLCASGASVKQFACAANVRQHLGRSQVAEVNSARARCKSAGRMVLRKCTQQNNTLGDGSAEALISAPLRLERSGRESWSLWFRPTRGRASLDAGAAIFRCNMQRTDARPRHRISRETAARATAEETGPTRGK
jgi:hypothetical protein